MIASFFGRRDPGIAFENPPNLVVKFLPGALNSNWVDKEILRLSETNTHKAWVARESIVYRDAACFWFLFPGGSPKMLPCSGFLVSMDDRRFESCIQLLSPGISMETFRAIVSQNLADQISEVQSCRGCRFYHGKEGVVCAVHPLGNQNCPDREVEDA